ncbi:MAG: ATP synthase F1 subunit gamma [Opitutales bacterium]|nr:ATP synthase F1 subunit gamma [Opitutales bacterium]
MKGIREIKARIRAVGSTSKITRAMQLVASSKMKKAQTIAIGGRPYILALSEIARDVSRLGPKLLDHPFFKKRESKNYGVLVIGTEKGLCGSFNQNISKKLVENFHVGSGRFFTIGKKATQLVSRLGFNLIADFSVSDRVELCEMRPIIELLRSEYMSGKIDSLQVVYSRSINPLMQEQVVSNVLPMSDLVSEIDALKKRMKISEDEIVQDVREIIFEPNVEDIVNKLSQIFFCQSIYRDVLESKAAEHSARMLAMKNATDNADSLAKNLTIEYNKARQAGITSEIIEIAAASSNGD